MKNVFFMLLLPLFILSCGTVTTEEITDDLLNAENSNLDTFVTKNIRIYDNESVKKDISVYGDGVRWVKVYNDSGFVKTSYYNFDSTRVKMKYVVTRIDTIFEIDCSTGELAPFIKDRGVYFHYDENGNLTEQDSSMYLK
jgi:hypothetical protein